MTTFIIATTMLFLAAGLGVLLERTWRRTAGLPRLPFGVDADPFPAPSRDRRGTR